jgi:hypothetical protein
MKTLGTQTDPCLETAFLLDKFQAKMLTEY